MPSDRKIEGILMPMPVAFKHDGAIDHKVLVAGAQQHAPERIRGARRDDRPPHSPVLTART